MDVRATIGWNMRRLRVAKGLSQERLALEAGIDRSYVGRIERGSENVTVSTLEAVAKLLEVEVADLFTTVTDAGNEQPRLPSGRKPKVKRGA
ncbi:helix-turn-helix domain-containing protein [Notoacmeibacter ruber]|uniref:XRE family transcriptional regulator n=1 Tax=Notoacmeibacter ruber TaxID=2670375 RepID=A0A3L7J8T4_9HYPH|nr:helix-turn-helix transcriptional regulator [Notoacmeibacter ruber]RLQ86834.1 XRE family transcriptional regulator [Notoacmeibacter ruber]